MATQCYIMHVNGSIPRDMKAENNETKPAVPKNALYYEEKSVGSTSFYKCQACPYMALAEDDIKFHLFTVHPDLAKSNGLADNIQIPCPGCTSVFDAEETLRTHLRSHHKMGIKDVKKMVKSLIQIALRGTKKVDVDKKEPAPAVAPKPDLPDVKIPQLIEIVPDVMCSKNESLPKGVSYISVDELQKMSTPNFEKIDPKAIIKEASINIVYTSQVSSSYASIPGISVPTHGSLVQLTSSTPDLISSIQPHVVQVASNQLNHYNKDQDDISSSNISQEPAQKVGRSYGSKTLGITNFKKNSKPDKAEITTKFGRVCEVAGCGVRLVDEDKYQYHVGCHRDGKLLCPECHLAFRYVARLHTHLWKTHSMDLELPTCETCGYKTYNMHRLNNIHKKSHVTERAYPCSVCSKAFKSSKHLSKHRQLHKVVKGVRCDRCGFEFSTERKLRQHITAVHDKVKPFHCSQCDYAASRKEELKLHMRCHTGEKPYSCNCCTYVTADHNALRRHKKQHTKEDFYKCKHCSYTCIQSTMLKAHLLSQHPDVSSEDVFSCPYCPYKSINRDKYLSHISNHTDKEGIQILNELTKSPPLISKPNWTIPSTPQPTGEAIKSDSTALKACDQQQKPVDTCKPNENMPIEVDDCDSQQENINQNYGSNYSCDNSVSQLQHEKTYATDDMITDLSKYDNNSDCVISESSNDTMLERHQYVAESLQNVMYENTQSNLHRFLNTSTIGQNLPQSGSVNIITSNSSPISNTLNNHIIGNFPIRLPPNPRLSIRNNFTLTPLDKIPLPMSKVTGPIIKPTQILPVPASSHSPINLFPDDGVPRKKPKISVKSNLVLKGPDQVNMFHSQQKMAFKQLADSEHRINLSSPVTFNNLITTQFMQLPPEPALNNTSDSRINNIIPYPQDDIVRETTNVQRNSELSENSKLYPFVQQMSVNPINMMSHQVERERIPSTDPSFIKLESTIKQNMQSPSLERMCDANALMSNQEITHDYCKTSPPLEEIHKNVNEIKNELKSDTFFNMALSNSTTTTQTLMDQYLIDNIIGVTEQYAGHLDLSSVVLPDIVGDQRNDVIEIDDNSEDNKMLPRFDMNFPLESLYNIHNDFHFLDSDISGQCSNSLTTELAVSEISRIVTEVPVVNHNKENISHLAAPDDFANFIHGKKDPMMNTSVRPTVNKINVKNIELMKN